MFLPLWVWLPIKPSKAKLKMRKTLVTKKKNFVSIDTNSMWKKSLGLILLCASTLSCVTPTDSGHEHSVGGLDEGDAYLDHCSRYTMF